MQITLHPLRSEGSLTLLRAGDQLTINGAVFDFSVLPEGASLPADAVDSPWIAGPVRREGGALELALYLPHGAAAPEAMRFPATISDPADGPVPLPGAVS